ncbi:ABC transporter substrate-binding protein [Nocardioides gansuensis]|uniref:ABC transporter substrate-binding protein n=1 Tax=Nocardioides gansuensis TaxID=2138300 RepID=A0A2T8F5E6_9ACTN|nr:ABC transporter substrate-binding protein [Nocardioides gansuensis]PVG80945.1 ABC transporter substrate-binding protein [Nocardioides gansuensis]
MEIHRIRRTAPRAVATLITVLAAAGCAAPAAPGAGDSAVLRVAGPFETHSVAPVESDGLFTRLEVVETLVSSDLEGDLMPGLATGWDESRGGRSWTFELPADVTFHDGTTLTADAAAASLRAAAEEEASPLAAAPIRGIEAEGDAVRIDLAARYPALPAVLTHYSTVVLAPSSYDADGAVTEVVGTGPYRVERLELPANIEVRRFEDYRGPAPQIERVAFQAVGRAESRALLAVGDQADVVFGLEPAGRERVDQAPGVAMESSLQPRSLLLKVNAKDPALADVRVRRALSMALDRAAIADAVLREPDLAATQLFPPSLTAWHVPTLDPLEQDVEQARELLAEAGWTAGPDGILEKDGEPLRLTLTTYPDRPELPALATAIQADLREVGVDLAVDVTNSSEIPARHADGTLDLGLLARHLALVTDPLVTVAEMFPPEGSDWGAMNWSDPALLDAIETLQSDADDTTAARARTTIAETAQAELPLIPVAWYRMNAAVNERVAGFVMDPLERTWHLSEMEWAS